MSDNPSKPAPKQNSRGCLTCAIFFVIFVIVFTTMLAFELLRMRERDRLHREQMNAFWREQSFNDVKNGDSHVLVTVPGLLPMLANDVDCVANLEIINFSNEITPEDAEHVARLINVKQLSFYDARGADYVLEHAHNLPIEELFFEVSGVSDESLRSLLDFPKLKKVQFEQMMSPDEIAILKQLRPEIEVEYPHPSESD